MTITYEKLYDDAQLPERATSQSAGYDLFAYLKDRELTVYKSAGGHHKVQLDSRGSIILAPGDRVVIPCGFKANLPDGYEAQIRPRSGNSLKLGLDLPNGPGTIDADFPGEWAVILKNASGASVEIEHGMRVGQAVLSRYESLHWFPGKVGVTTERVGGYGSTGK